MRADRLLAELNLLQARGRLTAAELAAELEVTERTIYRDMYALQVAGVPLVAERGRDGGYSLYGDWRAELTGLTTAEMESLLLASASSPTTRATATAVTAAAKLAAMLPAETADELSRLRRKIYVALESEGGHSPVGEVTSNLVDALRRDRAVQLVIRRRRSGQIVRTAHLIGLVIDGREWHVVWHAGDGRERVDTVDDVISAVAIADPVIEVENVGLDALWRRLVSRRSSHSSLQVRLAIDSRLVDVWRARYRTSTIEQNGDTATVVCHFNSILEARSAVLPWGGAVEVLSPPALRLSVADFAAQTVAVYTGSVT